MDKWIDPNEMLPEPISTVLIWTNISVYATLGYYIDNDWLFFSNSENFWLSKQPHIKVIAWQPLPERPSDDYIKNKLNKK